MGGRRRGLRYPTIIQLRWGARKGGKKERDNKKQPEEYETDIDLVERRRGGRIFSLSKKKEKGTLIFSGSEGKATGPF